MAGDSLARFSQLAEDDVRVKSPLPHRSGVSVWLSVVLPRQLSREPFVPEKRHQRHHIIKS